MAVYKSLINADFLSYVIFEATYDFLFIHEILALNFSYLIQADTYNYYKRIAFYYLVA